MTPQRARQIFIQTLTRINELSRERVLDVFKGQVDTCIASCLVVSEVLKGMDFEHKLVPCKAGVYNKLKGDGQWSVGISRHLVVAARDFILLDPSLDQVSRPTKGMNLTPLIYVSPYMGWLLSQGMTLNHCDCKVVYSPLDEWHLSAPGFVDQSAKDQALNDAIWVVEQLKAEGLVRTKP